ncbi:MAG: hypothetical protein QG625_3343 [Cyanobacteriota bacterium erpe_2018_sw_39hr_WHONDRS-SW48-000098_B_bin.30]|jgi:hypothetical protein|nr:zinc ribbon domain-containing protein [Candidatus Obscuribacter sp.]MBK9618506.1 zinc ribbon domain-containing protein [Candidatus Obscuribacter sp.]MDQ5967187.1 hypothetical protein [Cyanobacteriota bacterium erpe_2018_sw_39hr_WHONDRS-SW48-000098_B_bin.30]
MTTTNLITPGFGAATKPSTLVGCAHCNHYIESVAKFCGNCGAAHNATPTPVENKVSNVKHITDELRAFASSKNRAESNRANVVSAAQAKNSATPSFARKKKKAVSPAIREELLHIETMLVRERFFLLMHCGIFLVINLIGLFIACKCYFEYIGDEITKIMMASTPLLFINLVGLTCLVPIKGTKKEIARLVERKTYLKLHVEYDSLT